MPQTLTLSALALLALGGTASGVYLGRTAVAEIDPVHYSGEWKEARFFSDLAPGGRGGSDEAQPVADFAGLGDGCVNCRTYPEEYVPQHDGSVDAYEAAYPADRPTPVDRILADVDRQIAQMGRAATVQRYAAYPVEQRDEARPVVEIADAPRVATAVLTSVPADAPAPAQEAAEPVAAPAS